MTRTINIDPVTRIEGHLAIRLQIESNKVAEAYCSGEMFRGFEVILKNRDPMDAQQITQRICGVCPVSHGLASILAQEAAYKAAPPPNGRLVRNLILGANYIQSHIIHFYHLSALDFIDIKAIIKYTGKDPALTELKAWVNSQLSSGSFFPAAPFLPRYEGSYAENSELNIMAVKHYLDALEMRRLAHEMGALFAGKLPHAATLVPGGVTETVTSRKIVAYGEMLRKLKTFIDKAYLEDVLAVAQAFPGYFNEGKGCGNFLSYGVFQESDGNVNHFLPSGIIMNDGSSRTFNPSGITEDVTNSWYESSPILNPGSGSTRPVDPDLKTNAYSWLKAPRYEGRVMEVGPLARILIAYNDNSGRHQTLKNLVDGSLKRLGAKAENLISVMGRHATRAIECKYVADRCEDWLNALKPGEPSYTQCTIPKECAGIGLTEAPRGALGHFLQIENRKIANYQCVVPTTWNCSPRDGSGIPGTIEQALVGTPIVDPENPIEATRVVRSFDPCLACAVH